MLHLVAEGGGEGFNVRYIINPNRKQGFFLIVYCEKIIFSIEGLCDKDGKLYRIQQ